MAMSCCRTLHEQSDEQEDKGRPREIARSDFSCSTPAIPIRYRTRCVFQLVDEHICLVCA